MKQLDLFAGIGGISLAAEWAGIDTVAFCEKEPFAQSILRRRFPGRPIYDDVFDLTREVLERDGVISREREASTSSPVVSPVNLSAMQGSERARQTTATSGRKCAESLEKLDPLGCLLKMLMDSSVWLSPVGSLSWKTKQLYAKKRKWSSKQSGKTLKSSGIDPSQLLYQLAVSVPRTDDTGYSFWGTPSAADAVGSHGGGQGKSLRTDIANWKKGLWPTPRANDAVKRGNITDDPRNGLPGAVRLWPTPRAGDGNHGGPNSRDSRGNPALSGVVHLWPTPAAQDAKNATLPPSQFERDTVPGAVMRQGHQGQLNPEWMEALMNFPIGWTDGE